jgi:hypothetical protein
MRQKHNTQLANFDVASLRITATATTQQADVHEEDEGQSSLLTLAVSLLPKKIRNVCPRFQRFNEPFPERYPPGDHPRLIR